MGCVSSGGGPKPKPASHVPDPRPGNKAGSYVGVIGFYNGEAWDEFCGSSFLGNFFELGAQVLTLKGTGLSGDERTHKFTNAEAAFQALKQWDNAQTFERLSGEEAFRANRSAAASQIDWQYGGHGSNWSAMWAVLQGKFREGTKMMRALERTGDAFLLEHNPVSGRDSTWSDNHIGDGTNWLGLQLMLIRDQRARKKGWTQYLREECKIDTDSGAASGGGWQKLVRRATEALVGVFPAEKVQKVRGTPVCVRPGCGKPTWNGRENEYCTRSCRTAGPSGFGSGRF